MILGFTQEHGLPLDVVQDGYLFLVRNEHDWDEFRAGAELQRSLGIETQLLTPNEAAAIAPGIAIDDVVGATFCSDDGIADPSGLTQGYATLARRAGADLRLGVEVVEIETDGDAVTAVRTVEGSIATPTVVNAAGPWAGTLAATAGVSLPLEPIPRMVVTTGPFPGAPARRTRDDATTYYFHKPRAWVVATNVRRSRRTSTSLHRRGAVATAMRVFRREHWVSRACGRPESDARPAPVTSRPSAIVLAGRVQRPRVPARPPVVGKLVAELIAEGGTHRRHSSRWGSTSSTRGDPSWKDCRVSAGEGRTRAEAHGLSPARLAIPPSRRGPSYPSRPRVPACGTRTTRADALDRRSGRPGDPASACARVRNPDRRPRAVKIAFLHDSRFPVPDGGSRAGLQLAPRRRSMGTPSCLGCRPDVEGMIDGERASPSRWWTIRRSWPRCGPFWSEPTSVGALLDGAGVPTLSVSELGSSLASQGWSSWRRVVAGLPGESAALAAAIRVSTRSVGGTCLVGDGSSFSDEFGALLTADLGTTDIAGSDVLPDEDALAGVVQRVERSGCGSVAWRIRPGRRCGRD